MGTGSRNHRLGWPLSSLTAAVHDLGWPLASRGAQRTDLSATAALPSLAVSTLETPPRPDIPDTPVSRETNLSPGHRSQQVLQVAG